MSLRVGLLTVLGIIALVLALIGQASAMYALIAVAAVAFISGWAP